MLDKRAPIGDNKTMSQAKRKTCKPLPTISLPAALALIEAHYATLDEEEVWLDAASYRAHTTHEETPLPNGDSRCDVCGIIGPGADPVYHPEEYLHGSDATAALLVTCARCDRDCLAASAHAHHGQWIGYCCWDDRLKMTE